MNILLIQPNPYKVYRAYLPLGLAYVAGALRRSGHQVQVWDLTAAHGRPSQAEPFIASLAGKVDLVGITGLTGDYPAIKWLARTFKRFHPQLPLVVGGHLASALPEFVLRHLPVDIVVRGEGEQTVEELARAIEDGSDLAQIPGILFKDRNGGIVATPPRAPLADLSRLPLPPWDLFPMDVYLHKDPEGRGSSDSDSFVIGEMSIMASRGCPHHCIYCDHTIKGYRPRYRPVALVVDEIKAALARFGDQIKLFYFWDDILIHDRQWTLAFCQALQQENLTIQWTCNGHVQRVDAPLMEAMKAAGCVKVRFGLESGSQQILDALNKGVQLGQAMAALKTCLRAGLQLTIYLLVGMKGETQATIEETLSFMRQLIRPATAYQINTINTFLLTPFPGTRLFDEARARGLVGDLDAFLEKGFDASTDIPLNLSGLPDDELRRLKEYLAGQCNLLVKTNALRLHRIISEINQTAENHALPQKAGAVV